MEESREDCKDYLLERDTKVMGRRGRKIWTDPCRSGRPLNPTISLKDLRRKYRSGNHFLQSLKTASKVLLVGAEDDFRKALATRVVQG